MQYHYSHSYRPGSTGPAAAQQTMRPVPPSRQVSMPGQPGITVPPSLALHYSHRSSSASSVPRQGPIPSSISSARFSYYGMPQVPVAASHELPRPRSAMSLSPPAPVMSPAPSTTSTIPTSSSASISSEAPVQPSSSSMFNISGASNSPTTPPAAANSNALPGRYHRRRSQVLNIKSDLPPPKASPESPTNSSPVGFASSPKGSISPVGGSTSTVNSTSPSPTQTPPSTASTESLNRKSLYSPLMKSHSTPALVAPKDHGKLQTQAQQPSPAVVAASVASKKSSTRAPRSDGPAQARPELSSNVQGPRLEVNKTRRRTPQPETPSTLVLPSDVRRHSTAALSTAAPRLASPMRAPHNRTSSSSSLPNSILKKPSTPVSSQPEKSTIAHTQGTSTNSGADSKPLSSSAPHPQLATHAPVVSGSTPTPKSYPRRPPVGSIAEQRLSQTTAANSTTTTPPSPYRNQADAVETGQIPTSVTSISTASVDVDMPDASPSGLAPVDEEIGKRTRLNRLRKAFSFGTKRGMSPSSSSIGSSSTTRSYVTQTHPPRKKSFSTASIRSVFVPSSAPMTDTSDTRSMMSAKSTMSTISISTLKQMGKNLFKGEKQSNGEATVNGGNNAANSRGPAPATPFAPKISSFGGSNGAKRGEQAAKLCGPSAEPVVSYSAAEVESHGFSGPSGLEKSAAYKVMTERLPVPTPPESTTASPPPPPVIVLEAPPSPPVSFLSSTNESSQLHVEQLPSLTSSAVSSNSDDDTGYWNEKNAVSVDEMEDLTSGGDTVFPKKLDLLAVENIRSSLERTKSLERRRSKRSTRSSKAAEGEPLTSDSDKETVPNPTEVHVHDEDIDHFAGVPDVTSIAPKSILKPKPSFETISSQKTVSESPYTLDPRQGIPRSPSFDVEKIVDFGSTGDNLDLDLSFGSTLGGASSNLDIISDSSAEPRVAPVPPLPTKTEGPVPALTVPTPEPAPVSPQPNEVQYDYQPSQYRANRPAIRKGSSERRGSSGSSTISAESPQQPTANSQYFLHPLYQKRLSQFIPSHNRGNTSSTVSTSSSTSIPYQGLAIRPASRVSATSANSSQKSTVTFSSRIVIYDTYDCNDYDRRAELATCNRLTPMLAQQIKEELNNFKMEMDIHADSKIYTHFV